MALARAAHIAASYSPTTNPAPTTLTTRESILLDFERRVCQGLFSRLFTPDVAKSFMKSVYNAKCTEPLFVDEPGESDNPPVTPYPGTDKVQSDDIWCRFEVNGLMQKHFAKDAFPEFTIRLVQLNGDDMPRLTENGLVKPMNDMKIQISVFNKWADVTSEVVSDTETTRVLKDGMVTISDLVFHEISLKHGGYFILSVRAIDYAQEVLEWASGKITIQSVKTHCNQKRKRTEISNEDEDTGPLRQGTSSDSNVIENSGQSGSNGSSTHNQC
eukprot:c4357_g1_i1.p1 GENE.c4357_g1_i1~~c4357_g1_i1.p1  ORF type:complete len:291 (+),score=60.78 c4357_g1_i1:58-873(+)